MTFDRGENTTTAERIRRAIVALASTPESGPSYARASDIFLRLLGLVYFFAFVSLWWQIEGLIGSRGILPASNFLSRLSTQLGGEAILAAPTLLWISSSDATLHGLCAAGVLASLLLLCARLRCASLLIAWCAYLSLVTAGQIFLGYQWDGLLLEVGFLAFLLVPPRFTWYLTRCTSPGPCGSPGTSGRYLTRYRAVGAPPRLVVFLFHWLLFRLMFGSGIVKLTSGDSTWRQLRALDVHYETQPLPTWIGWHAHQLPAPIQQTSVLVMFAIELAVPFLVFCGARARRVAFVPLAAFQLLIAATGNYGYFNLLSLALCLPLLDDDLLRAPAAFAARLHRSRRGDDDAPARGWPPWVLIPVAALLLALSAVALASTVGARLPQPMATVYRQLAPFRVVNRYGLFAVMTTARPEIEVQGSDDGEVWRTYRLPYKADEPHRRPRFVAPHQPRLDWQMWFAALGTYRHNPWFLLFLARLAEGSPPVTALLRENPFPDEPPRYFRALSYDYRFTNRDERRRTAAWWRRTATGEYLGTVEAQTLRKLLPSSDDP